MLNGRMATVEIAPVIKCIDVELPPARAFRLFTEEIGRWWPLVSHSVHGAEAVACHMEGHAGGRLYETHRDGRESEWGVVEVWEPPARLAFTLHPGQPAAEATYVEVAFENRLAGTRLTLTHTGWERRGALGPLFRERYEGGWNPVLERFRAHADAAGQAGR